MTSMGSYEDVFEYSRHDHLCRCQDCRPQLSQEPSQVRVSRRHAASVPDLMASYFARLGVTEHPIIAQMITTQCLFALFSGVFGA